MELFSYSYGSVVRILAVDPKAFENSVMIDVDAEKRRVLSVFDARRKFDADFIQSYLNILRESRVGFMLLTDSYEDATLKMKAFAILKAHSAEYTEIPRLLSIIPQ